MTPSSLPTTRPAPFHLHAEAVEALTGGQWHGGARHAVIHGATLDSRAVAPGSLFVCIRGERVDGHDFAAGAVGDGAALVLASRPLHLPVPVLVVADAARALGQLAAEFRDRCARWTGGGPRWIAVCGANGKTTTKELLASACAGTGQVVHATRGNLNNHLGVPLTVLATPADAAWCVIEIGTNAPGEVAALAPCAKPQVAVVTSIGPEHLEGFGDLAGVAREECSIFASLPADGTAFVGLHGAVGHGADAAQLANIARAAAGSRTLHLLDDVDTPTGVADVPVHGQAGELSLRLDTFDGSTEIALLGAHNLANAALAFHAVVAAGVAPQAALAGLSRALPVAGRLVPRPAGAHLVLDDTYNANPASMIAGLRVLANCPGRHLAILGPMGELGAAVAEGHRVVGAEARRLGLPLLVVAGRGALAGLEQHLIAGYGAAAQLVADRPTALAAAQRLLTAGSTTVLVKASRSQGLEQVVTGLCAATPSSSSAPSAGADQPC